MGGVEKVGAPVVEHSPPTGRGRGHAETQEAHGRFGQYGASHPNGRLHDDGLNNVGKNMANDDAEIARAQSFSGFDEFAFASRENLSTNQAGVANPASQRKRQHEIEDAGPAEGDERDGQQDSRE